MKHRYRRLQRLERRLAALATSTSVDVSDDAVAVWCRGSCVGPMPPPGPQPVKYTSAQWQAQHRLFLTLFAERWGSPIRRR